VRRGSSRSGEWPLRASTTMRTPAKRR
jgi:hypothetical protein